EGYHFTKEALQKNDKYNDKIIDWLHANKKVSSISAHTVEEIKNYAGKFNHVIVSPVFKSISKKNSYDWDFQELKKMFTDHRSQITKYKGDPSTVNCELFAVGGIDLDKIEKIKEMHFDGFGLLGALWKNPEIAIEKFKTIISYDSRLTTHDS
ncbi:MAG: thiamine monophosphate synthase, partial [Bacteroidota bacterium]|nr:thiamine monophosphate synthase [Bacteroidota bacterium]